MIDLVRDVRLGFRRLSKAPGFTLAAVATLALGIGASTAIFSVVNPVLLQPLPYQDSDRLVAIWEENLDRRLPGAAVSPPNFTVWSERASSFEGLSIVSRGDLVLTRDGQPRRVAATHVSPSFFEILGVRPALGRGFRPDDGRVQGSQAAILSNSAWQRLFGGDASVVGSTVKAEDGSLTVVGVLPPEFYFPQASDLWLAKTFSAAESSENMTGARYLSVIGRLKTGVGTAAASAELNQLTHRKPVNQGWQVRMIPLLERTVAGHRAGLALLAAAVAMVLIIACANVANLILFRASGRGRELAMKSALGATRVRLLREALVENLMLFMAGGLAGFLLCVWSVEPLLALAPRSLPRASFIRVDGSVLAFSLLVSLLTGLVFSAIPSIRVARTDLNLTLKNAAVVSASLGGRRLRKALVVGEVTVAFVLLLAASTLTLSFIRTTSAPLGFDPGGVLSFSLSLPAGRYPDDDRRKLFTDRLLEGFESLPGVKLAGLSTNLPLTGSTMTFGFRVDGEDEPHEQFGEYHATSPGYFATMGIPLVGGRFFDEQDRADAVPVVIVNETLARSNWPKGEAVGRRLTVASRSGLVVREVVGVVGDVRHVSLSATAEPELYVPYAQDPWPFFSVVLRGTPSVASLPAAARQVVAGVDPNLPVDGVGELQGVVRQASAPQRFLMTALTLFGGAGLLLAAVGIYGVVAAGVHQRLREIGLRMALGAERAQIFKMFLREGLGLSTLGMLIGGAASIAFVRLLAAFLEETSPAEPALFLFSAAVILLATALACSLPAARASRTDPIRVLRWE